MSGRRLVYPNVLCIQPKVMMGWDVVGAHLTEEVKAGGG